MATPTRRASSSRSTRSTPARRGRRTAAWRSCSRTTRATACAPARSRSSSSTAHRSSPSSATSTPARWSRRRTSTTNISPPSRPPRRRRASPASRRWAFRVIPSDSANGLHDRAASPTSSGAKRAAVLYENNPYGRGLADNFRKSFHGQIISIDPIAEGDEQTFEVFVSWYKSSTPRSRLRRRHRRIGHRVPQGSAPAAARPPISSAATDGRRSRRSRSPKASTSARRSARRILAPKFRRSSPPISGSTTRSPTATRRWPTTPRNCSPRRWRRSAPNRIKIRDYLAHLVDQGARIGGVTGTIRFGSDGDPDRQAHRHDARASGRAAGGGESMRRLVAHATSTRSAAASGWASAFSWRCSSSPASWRDVRSPECRTRSRSRSPKCRPRRSSRARSRRTSRRPSRRDRAISRRRTPTAQNAFRKYGWAAHEVQRADERPSESVGDRSRDRRDDRQQAVGDGSVATRWRIDWPISAAPTRRESVATKARGVDR